MHSNIAERHSFRTLVKHTAVWPPQRQGIISWSLTKLINRTRWVLYYISTSHSPLWTPTVEHKAVVYLCSPPLPKDSWGLPLSSEPSLQNHPYSMLGDRHLVKVFLERTTLVPFMTKDKFCIPRREMILSRDAQESSIWSVLDLPRKYRRAEYDWGSLGARSLRQTHHDYWRSLTASSISGTRRQKAAKTEVSSMCQL